MTILEYYSAAGIADGWLSPASTCGVQKEGGIVSDLAYASAWGSVRHYAENMLIFPIGPRLVVLEFRQATHGEGIQEAL